MKKLNTKELKKFWKLLLPPYCFGNPYYLPCSARYLPDCCSVCFECSKECRRKEEFNIEK